MPEYVFNGRTLGPNPGLVVSHVRSDLSVYQDIRHLHAVTNDNTVLFKLVVSRSAPGGAEGGIYYAEVRWRTSDERAAALVRGLADADGPAGPLVDYVIETADRAAVDLLTRE